MTVWTALFWKQVAERAVKTFAQSILALFAADEVFSILDVDLNKTFGVAALALVASVLTSLVSANVGPEKESPSLTETTPQ